MRYLFLLLAILATAGPCLAAEVPPVEVMGLLGSRELVGTVAFTPGDDQLSPLAKAELDRISDRLATAGKNAKLIRVEGFSSREETSKDSLGLSMARARTVEVYLREFRKITSDIYLMGHGDNNASPAAAKVEVALYDTLLPINDAPVDHIIKKW